ncbi:MAG: hypothetical protein EXS63_04750 [Candidatus Omnitrophica bacterium]|nr:hypothetical protein [Candidatus Omnitrophota bacterium]
MNHRFPFFLFLTLISTPPLWAVDLGGAGANDKPVKVTVEEQPIKVSAGSEGDVVEITAEAQLNYGEIYESDYVDVKKYQHATFYVMEKNDNSIKVVSTPPAPVRYQLDAFFTIEQSTTKIMSFGDDKPKIINKGIQEFGSQFSKEEGDANPSFEKISTGETSTRALHTRIYGPYVRLVLKSLSKNEQQRYRIVAYLTQ